jgi:hypothetical protein
MVTDQQIKRLYKMSHTEETQEIAAAKAGMDVKTAHKYLRARRLPSEMKAERHWRTRTGCLLVEVWPEIAAQLSANAAVEAKTLFARLQQQYPERFVDGQLRTLQRYLQLLELAAREGEARVEDALRACCLSDSRSACCATSS